MSLRRLLGKARSVGWLVHGGCGIVVVSVACLTVVLVMRIDVEARAAGLSFAVARLEQTIGYGGLIQHAKNAMVRGADDPEYYLAALQDIELARTRIAQIDRIQRELGLGAPLTAQKMALNVYRGRLDAIALMHEQGRSVLEIDAAVRFDDQSALSRIDELHTQIAGAINRRLLLLRVAGAILTLSILVGGGLSLVAPMVSRLRKRNRDLEAFTDLAANDLLGPLRRIRMMSERVAEEALDSRIDEARLRSSARALFATAASLDRAFTGTLDYMRAGRPSIPREVNLVNLLTTLRHLSTPSPAELVIVDPMPVIEAPVPEIEIVLRHLLEYSVEWHPDRAPRVEVAYGRTDRGHRITITATGGDRLEPDRHVPRDVSRPGMRLLRTIVDDWGGSVEVDRDPGNGVVIVLEWPL